VTIADDRQLLVRLTVLTVSPRLSSSFLHLSREITVAKGRTIIYRDVEVNNATGAVCRELFLGRRTYVRTYVRACVHACPLGWSRARF